MLVCNCFPQLQKKEGMKEASRVHDAFFMTLIRRIEGAPKKIFSTKVVSLLAQFNKYYIQFNTFFYLRIGGYEKAPLKLLRYISDYLVFLEVCRQMTFVNIKYVAMKKKGYTFSLNLSHFTCKSNEATKFFDKLLAEFGFHSLPLRSNFDSKGYFKHNFYGAS